MISIQGKYFYKDGQRFFYLADTNWSAFGSMSMKDWQYYLDSRKAEGFNAIQINILRQYDSTSPLPEREPFKVNYLPNGKYEYDYTAIDDRYFNHAERMLDEMILRNMLPVLVLLWGNFVPGTWMNDPNNGFVAKASKPNIMPIESIAPYIEYVTKRFKKYRPIYFVSGDVGFDQHAGQDPEKEIVYYREVLKTAKKIDPDAIYTFHINGGSKFLPEEFETQVDFFSYQSGHNSQHQETSHLIPEFKRQKGYEAPIVDTELCYEGLNKFHSNVRSRYSAYDVRKAAWSAVLAGADAGLGYGSFGIWPWQDNYQTSQQSNGFLEPYDWRTCLRFRGAKDLGFLKQIILDYASEGLNPLKVESIKQEDIKVAENDRYVFIYNPCAGKIDVSSLNFKNHDYKAIDLQTLRISSGHINEGSLPMMPMLEDVLIIINK